MQERASGKTDEELWLEAQERLKSVQRALFGEESVDRAVANEFPAPSPQALLPKAPIAPDTTGLEVYGYKQHEVPKSTIKELWQRYHRELLVGAIAFGLFSGIGAVITRDNTQQEIAPTSQGSAIAVNPSIESSPDAGPNTGPTLVEPTKGPTKHPAPSELPTHHGDPVAPKNGYKPAPDGEINVGTFNIYHKGNQPKGVWQGRLRKSAAVIWQNKLDIVATQENRPEQQSKLLTYLNKLGGHYKKYPEISKQQPGFSPNAIYYNSKRFIIDKAHSKLVKIKYDNGKLTKKMVLVKLIERKKGPDGVRGEIVAISSHDPANVRPGSERVNAHSREYNAEHVYIPLFEKYTKKGIPVVAGMDANSPYDAAPNCTMTQASTLKDSYEIYLEEKMQGVNHTCKDGRPSRYGKEIDREYVSNGLEVTNIWTAAAGRYNNGSDIHDTYMVTVDTSNWGQ